MSEWAEWILKLGSLAGAITGVAKFILSITRKLQETNAKRFERALEPLSKAIEQLNHLLVESQKDRESLHEKANIHDTRIDKHDTRITALETWREEHRFQHK